MKDDWRWSRDFDGYLALLDGGPPSWEVSIGKGGYIVPSSEAPPAVVADDLESAQRQVDDIVMRRLGAKPLGEWTER